MNQFISTMRRTISTHNRAFRYALVMVVVLAMTAVSFAQTPVPIVVDTNEIFSQTNNWIEVFVPIVAIGIGIAVALAILRFIGKQIVDAFS